MAAGLGYIEFTTGDVLTAAQANGYLASQVVMVFASSAARTSAIASPQEGMFSYLKDTNATEYYSGSAWVAIGGGLASPLTTKGDVWGYSTTNARIPVGTNGQVLTADSTEALGVKWATAASSAGSTLIETQTFSAVSAVNFTSKISSTYDNYFMIFDVSASSAGNEDLFIRLRSGSTDNSNSTYNRQLLIASVSTVSTARATSQDALTGCIINSSGRSVGELYVCGPNLAQNTYFTITNNNPDSTVASRYINGNFAASTTFDGISFIPGSGTITGRISLYGLAK